MTKKKITLSEEQLIDAKLLAANPDLPDFSKAGTGKTHKLLGAHKLTGAGRLLILAPVIGLKWWLDQAQDFLDIEGMIMRSSATPLTGDLIVTTYDLARNSKGRLYEYFSATSDDIGQNLINDESHYIRSVDAKRTLSLFGNDCIYYEDGMPDLSGGLVNLFDSVWNATGTPKEKWADDYYTQACLMHSHHFANYGINSYADFCYKFTFTKRKKFHPRMAPVNVISGDRHEKLLNKILYEEIGCIRRSVIHGLPPLTTAMLEVPVTLDKSLREELAKMTIDDVEAAFATVNSPQGGDDDDMIVNQIARLTGLGKVKEIADYVIHIARNEPVLLGCWYRDVMNEYERIFNEHGLDVVQVNGSTNPNHLDQIQSDFNAGRYHVLIGQQKKMGVSWNLQGLCRRVVIAEIVPSHAVFEQFYKRVFRRGQTGHVMLDVIMAPDTTDPLLWQVRERKERGDKLIHGES